MESVTPDLNCVLNLSSSYSSTATLRRTLYLFVLSSFRSLVGSNLRVGERIMPMIDPDLISVVILLVVVMAALLVPPGPGTPLQAPVPSR